MFADAETDQSLMVDMLEMVECGPQEAAAKHFRILAETNESQRAELLNTTPPVVNADGRLVGLWGWKG